MPRRRQVKLVRPYQDETAFVEAEGWTLGKRSILLIDAPDLEVGTEVRCDVSLESGQTLIRAEGRIVEQIAPDGDRPGGLKLRFQRVAPETKALIGRVLTEVVDSGPAASPGPLPPPAETADPDEADPDEADPDGGEPPRAKRSDSGFHQRVVAPVEPPPNREQLLDRLRARQRRRIEDEESEPPSEHPEADENAG